MRPLFHPEMPDNYKYTDFCASSDLPDDRKSMFLIEDNIGRTLICFTLARWKQINGLPESKGVSADRLYVLPDDQIERDPKVRIDNTVNK